jgi:hypothetical protein
LFSGVWEDSQEEDSLKAKSVDEVDAEPERATPETRLIRGVGG